MFPCKMIMPMQVRARRKGHALRGCHPHQERTHGTRDRRSPRRRRRCRRTLTAPRRFDGLGEARIQRFHVPKRRDLGHDAAEALVQVHLSSDEVRPHGEAVLDRPRRRFRPPRGFDAEGDSAGRTPSGDWAAISARRTLAAALVRT